MASVPAGNLSAHEKDELVCSYAALLLQDDGQEITADALNKVIKASGNSVESYWPGLFAKAIAGTNIADIIANIGSAPAPAAAAAAGTAAPAPAAKKEEPKEEASPVSLGNVFGDDDEY